MPKLSLLVWKYFWQVRLQNSVKRVLIQFISYFTKDETFNAFMLVQRWAANDAWMTSYWSSFLAIFSAFGMTGKVPSESGF